MRPMMQRDAASAMLGMVIELDVPGEAIVSMTVRDDMLNGFAITHGGLVFTLADTAFAIACNEDERVTVAGGADITFLKSTTAGQRLTARAVRRAAIRTGGKGFDGRWSRRRCSPMGCWQASSCRRHPATSGCSNRTRR